MPMYNDFVAELECPTCGELTHSSVQTDLVEDQGLQLRVGDLLELEVPTDGPEGYFMLERTRAREPEHVSVLEPWCCPACGIESLVRIDIDDKTVTAIEAITPSSTTLAPVTRVSFEVRSQHFEPTLLRIFPKVAEDGSHVLLGPEEMIEAIVSLELFGHRVSPAPERSEG
jgi:hypothetical protein